MRNSRSSRGILSTISLPFRDSGLTRTMHCRRYKPASDAESCIPHTTSRVNDNDINDSDTLSSKEFACLRRVLLKDRPLTTRHQPSARNYPCLVQSH
jgi:hypothetical protein